MVVTIEGFFVLAAVVVVIGLVVWRRDVKSGRILRPAALTRARYVRDLFVDTRSPAVGAPPAPDPKQAHADAHPTG
jgi:hypothetical protein